MLSLVFVTLDIHVCGFVLFQASLPEMFGCTSAQPRLLPAHASCRLCGSPRQERHAESARQLQELQVRISVPVSSSADDTLSFKHRTHHNSPRFTLTCPSLHPSALRLVSSTVCRVVCGENVCLKRLHLFIYFFRLLLYTRILNSHLQTDEPLASNVVFAGTPPVSL